MNYETSKKKPLKGIYAKLAKTQTDAQTKKATRCPETNPNGGTATCSKDKGHEGEHMNRGGIWSSTHASDESEKMNDISSPSGDSGNDKLIEDNLEAAVGALERGMAVGASTGSEEGEPAQKVVYVRVSVGKHGEWSEVAEGRGVSLSEFVRSCVDPVVDGVLRCPHLRRQTYTWSDTCLDCGKRLSG